MKDVYVTMTADGRMLVEYPGGWAKLAIGEGVEFRLDGQLTRIERVSEDGVSCWKTPAARPTTPPEEKP
jgi:hypothetical protein